MSGSQKVPLLDIRNLKTYFYTEVGIVRAVDGVNLRVYPGEIVGLVGESGCGKSVTSLSIMRLISTPGKITDGEIWFNEKNLLALSQNEMRDIRGNLISMIFQQPQTSLNPIFSAGDQIAEVLQTHKFLDKNEVLDFSGGTSPAGWDSGSRTTGKILPARVVRRTSSARHDRHCTGALTAITDRR